MKKYCIALSTFASKEQAQGVIDKILEEKLAACIQVLDIKSHYMWEGSVCHDDEVLILFKTSWDMYEELEQHIKELHPYDTPEIIAIDIEKGYKGYLDWIDEVTS